MALLSKIRDFTQYVYDVEDTEDELRFTSVINEPNAAGRQGLDEAAEKYAHIKKIPVKEAILICSSAYDQNYVHVLPVKGLERTSKVAPIPYNASKLLDRNFLNMPKGLFKTWLDDMYKPINLVMTFIAGIIIGLIPIIISLVKN